MLAVFPPWKDGANEALPRLLQGVGLGTLLYSGASIPMALLARDVKFNKISALELLEVALFCGVSFLLVRNADIEGLRLLEGAGLVHGNASCHGVVGYVKQMLLARYFALIDLGWGMSGRRLFITGQRGFWIAHKRHSQDLFAEK